MKKFIWDWGYKLKEDKRIRAIQIMEENTEKTVGLRMPNAMCNVDGSYPEPPPFKGIKWREYGRSSIPQRNGWSWMGNLKDFSKVEDCEIEDHERIYIVPLYTTLDEFVEEFNEFVLKFKIDWIRKEKVSKLFKDSDVEVWKEFNKSHIYKFVKDFDGKDFFVLHEYITTCSNTTVILSLPKERLSVPDNLKGLIIGKNGQNIKRVQEKYKIKLKIN